jgi:hypothetical protein
MSYTPNARTDIFIRVTQTLKTYKGEPAPDGSTITISYPVVGWTDDGTPLVITAPASAGSTSTNGRMVLATNFPDYQLYVASTRNVPTANATDVVEVIPGSSDELVYKLTDGSTHRGVIPLWGRRADGSLVALLTAETVPHVRSVERDEAGEIVGVVEQ